MTDEKKFSGWKRTYIGLLNAATVICILLGIMIHFGGWFGSDLLRGFTGSFARGDENVSESAVVNSSTEAFDNITGYISAGNIEIVAADDYGYSYEGYPEKEAPKISINNGVLKIEQKSKKSGKLTDFKNRYHDARILITMPSDKKADTSLTLSMGAFSAEGVSFGKFKLVANMGSIDLKDVTAKDLNIDADMGGITLTDTSFSDGEINADMGGIDLKDVTFDEADLEAAMGGITVTGNFNELDCECSMGGITVTCENDEAKLDLSADMGGITVNGEDVGRKYKN